MPSQLITDKGLADDVWLTLPAADLDSGELIPEGQIIVPADSWLLRRQEFIAHCNNARKIGVSIPSSFAIEQLADDFQWMALIAIEFPKFADGRGYSTARLLRERYGYKKELRAVGDVGRDQLFLLKRVGFDSFLIPEGRDPINALEAFKDFPDVYQAATDQALPLFRRRTA